MPTFWREIATQNDLFLFRYPVWLAGPMFWRLRSSYLPSFHTTGYPLVLSSQFILPINQHLFDNVEWSRYAYYKGTLQLAQGSFCWWEGGVWDGVGAVKHRIIARKVCLDLESQMVSSVSNVNWVGPLSPKPVKWISNCGWLSAKFSGICHNLQRNSRHFRKFPPNFQKMCNSQYTFHGQVLHGNCGRPKSWRGIPPLHPDLPPHANEHCTQEVENEQPGPTASRLERD